MNGLTYALLCVLGPGAWGLLMYLVFGWLRDRQRAARQRGGLPPVDYSI
jgi:hypothetical protein